MSNTKIDWAEKVWNPVTGCTPVSPGCQNCYARKMANRLRAMGQEKYKKGFEVAFHPDSLNEPRKWKKPSRVFICSMGDLFHDEVKDDWLGAIFHAIDPLLLHQFLILTKRPKNIPSWLYRQLQSCWLGVSCENQEWADKRIPLLLEIPAVVRWASLEPLLGPINIYNTSRDYLGPLGRPGAKPVSLGLSWCVVGAESGPGRRPCKLEWVSDIVRQCKAAAVPCFVKQIEISDKVSHDPQEWPEDLRIREFPLGS
ncbi:MAG: DUF5131 family protein [Planctomycetota bacterium]